MQIREVMTSDYKVVKPDCSLKEAAGFMLKEDTGSLPVCDGDTVLGMITDRDIAVRAVAEGRDPSCSVSEFMTDHLVIARESDDIDTIAHKMADHQVRRLPVIDDNSKLVGVVSLGDLARSSEEGASSAALEGVSERSELHNQS
ncbi:CBS domain-containing protein [Sphingomicrobium clamense]|uniref:CBS domain-containing protein n=1 Tax=Sphingomicrobium clamense TaxID=2851013 RepID=A0ABS6V578_9SPHN|nr:CBS domain-containing protein [Sphingomicrobium sp. B8]MBW0144711.1 CBS domain-containing protein [Sphingomicrobium sp. B8]